MASVTFQGNAVSTIGQLPEVGAKAPDFTLVVRALCRFVNLMRKRQN